MAHKPLGKRKRKETKRQKKRPKDEDRKIGFYAQAANNQQTKT